jgi:actin-related protein
MSRVLVIDNGAWEFKWGWNDAAQPKSTPNCIVKRKGGKNQLKRRLVVGEETRELKESGTVYRRPFERGHVVDWGLEQRLWESEKLPVRGSSVLVTVPPLQVSEGFSCQTMAAAAAQKFFFFRFLL